MFDFSNDVALQSGICSENKILFLGEFIFDKFLPKISYCYLKSGIEDFHRTYVLVPADKAANNVVVV